jgi:hypothetical protein
LSAKENQMLRLTRAEEGACYVTDTTNLYVAWSMLCSASKLFWGCGIIKDLDRAKSLSDQAFGDKPEALPELIELLQNVKSPVLDAVRIVICFENYFKAKMLLEGYVIHQMDLAVCRQYFPQFVTGNSQKVVLQKTAPILIDDVKQAEKQEDAHIKPLRTLTKHTIGISILLGQPKYRSVYLRDQTLADQKLLYLVQSLNGTRNTLHFLNIEYIASGRVIGDFIFLRDCVTSRIDVLANKMVDDDKWKLDVGKAEIEHLLDGEFDDAL